MCDDTRQCAPIRADAGKEGRLSNHFVPDLDAITDFLDRYRVEIELILKEEDQFQESYLKVDR